MTFPFLVGLLYTLAAIKSPDRAIAALQASGCVFLQIVPALAAAFGVMILLNRFVTPNYIKRFLGKGSSFRGVFLFSAAGILSMGPIYAWYPLLKDLREKDVSDLHLASFLGCRAVKIPLLPMMAGYFGWLFTLILTGLILFHSISTALVVAIGKKTASRTSDGTGNDRL